MPPPPRKSREPPSSVTSTASRIAPGVFVGGWADAHGFQGTRFCVLDEVPDAPLPAEVHLPIYDEAKDEAIRGNLDRLADLVEQARARKEPVLIFCGHGVRRGPLGGAWYLHRHERIPLAEAYARLRAVRPQAESVEAWVGNTTNLAAADATPVLRTLRGPDASRE
jgi:hypothetical protein